MCIRDSLLSVWLRLLSPQLLVALKFVHTRCPRRPRQSRQREAALKAAARPFFASSSCRRCARCGRPGRLGTCSVAARAWRRAAGDRPWLIFLVGRTWPCLRLSPSSGGRPASLARRRLADRSARARFDLFLVGSLHLAQDAPFVLQLGSALLLGVMRLAEMSCCRRDGPRSIVRAVLC